MTNTVCGMKLETLLKTKALLDAQPVFKNNEPRWIRVITSDGPMIVKFLPSSGEILEERLLVDEEDENEITQKPISSNIKTEIAAGTPKNDAIAIALATAGNIKKKAGTKKPTKKRG